MDNASLTQRIINRLGETATLGGAQFPAIFSELSEYGSAEGIAFQNPQLTMEISISDYNTTTMIVGAEVTRENGEVFIIAETPLEQDGVARASMTKKVA